MAPPRPAITASQPDNQVSCVTSKGRKRNTARHHPRETSALGSAGPNHHTDPPNTVSAERTSISSSRMPREHELAEIASMLRRAVTDGDMPV
jgi:hypothetical protein